MSAHEFVLQMKVVLKHPRLLTSVYRGEIEAGKAHLRIELERAKSLPLSSVERDHSVAEIVQEFKSRICYPNAYLYAICKLLTPQTVVETGVKRGTSTAFILQAILENGRGHLYSIDLPNVVVEDDRSNILPKGASTGFLVPAELAGSNWTLVLGDSKEQLPKLLEGLESVDIFHHDSLHTYEHMMFEYRAAWPKLSKGGLLLSDDAKCNTAFTDFCSQVGVTGSFVGDSGIAFKSG